MTLKAIEDEAPAPPSPTSAPPSPTSATPHLAALSRLEAAEQQLADLQKQNAALKKELERGPAAPQVEEKEEDVFPVKEETTKKDGSAETEVRSTQHLQYWCENV